MTVKKKILIIGGDSLIGKFLYEKFKIKNNVIRTSRIKKKNSVFFDLKSSDFDYFKTNNFDYVFFLIAESNLNKCESDPETYFINVVQTKKILHILLNNNERIIFPSTNFVLSCEKDLQDIDEISNPICKYGEHKLELENYLFKKNSCVIRLSKIVDLNIHFFKNISESIIQKKEISLYDDYYFSPISINYFYAFIKLVLEKDLLDLWHICAEEQISYYKFALEYSKYLGITNNKIIAKKKRTGLLPKFTKLSCKKAVKQYKFYPQSLNNLFRDLTNG